MRRLDSRTRSCASAGCPLNSGSVMRYLPSSPRSAAARGSGQLTRTQPVEFIGGIEHHGESVGIVQQVALEGVGQRRQLLVQSRQLRLVLVVETRARVRHLAVMALHEVALLGVEVQGIALLVHPLHPPVELTVERDRVLVGRHERCELLIDLLDLGRRIGRAHRVEGVRDAVEQFA